MNMKKMTAVCVLLASGGLPHALADSNSELPDQNVSSQMAASTFPDEEGEVGGDGEGGGEEVDPPAPTVDKTALSKVIAEANLSIYQYVKDQAIEAQKVLDDENATQEEVNAATQKLEEIIQNTQKLEKETFKAVDEETLKAKYFDFYGQPTGEETETDAFPQSDFGELNQMVKDTINYLLPDFALNEDEQNTIKTGLERQFQICIARSNSLLVDYSNILIDLIAKIDSENSVYQELTSEQTYITTKSWEHQEMLLQVIQYVEPGSKLRKLNKDGEEEEPEGSEGSGEGETPGDDGPKYDIELVKEKHDVYIISHVANCNITTIKDNGNILATLVALTDVKIEAQKSSDEALETLNQYFTAEEQNGANPEWQKVNALIETLNDVIATATEANDIYDAQAKVNESLNNLSTLSSGRRTALQDKLNEAKQLLGVLADQAEEGKDNHHRLLQAVITEATTLLNSDSKVLSAYTGAAEKLDAQIEESTTYYEECAKGLSDLIATVESWNEEVQDKDLAAALQTAKEKSALAAEMQLIDTSIDKAVTDLQEAYELAQNRNRANAEIKSLQECIDTYGDEDGRLTELQEKAKNVSNSTAEQLWDEIENAIKATKALSETCQTELTAMIERAERYYSRWQTTLGEKLDNLKTEIDNKKQLLNKEEKNIANLKEAYTELDNVYREAGGYSDPYEYQQTLGKLIDEAEKVQDKYNYASLGDAIAASKSVVGSEDTYKLQQQRNELQREIEQTQKQYILLTQSLDEYISNTVEPKMAARYADDIPEDQAELIEKVKADLQLSQEEEAVEGDRVCTDMMLLQQYQRNMQTMLTDVDAAWNKAVADLEKAINETKLTFDQNYPNEEKLGDAINKAQSILKEINTAPYQIIANVEQAIKNLDTALMNVEGSLRRGVANNWLEIYTNLEKNIEKYGSDENSVPTSNAKQYVEKNEDLNNELTNAELNIPYSMTTLEAWLNEIKAVEQVYSEFCKASSILRESVKNAKVDLVTYYGDRTEDTHIQLAVDKAEWAIYESCNQDSLVFYNLALKDSVALTLKDYGNAVSELRMARNVANSKHNVYYGTDVKESNILTMVAEADVLIKNEKNIYTLQEKTIAVNGCYADIQSACAQLEEEIQTWIDRAEALNRLMQDDVFDNSIAEAINARYAQDGRITAIEEHMAQLKQAYETQSGQYDSARKALQEKVTAAEALWTRTEDETLATLIATAQELLAQSAPETERTALYADLTQAADNLTARMDEIKEELNTEIGQARSTLIEARNTAIGKHNYYYGMAQTDSEILKVCREAESYLESDDIEAVRQMTEQVLRCYLEASVNCANQEARAADMLRKSASLAVLMDDAEMTTLAVAVEEACRMENGRLTALNATLPGLTDRVTETGKLYDTVALSLSDSIAMAKELLQEVTDAGLQAVLSQAEKAWKAADKLLVEATTYTVLQDHLKMLSDEIERVIKELNPDGIGWLKADGHKVPVYNLQGRLLKHVDLQAEDAFHGLSDGIYIVGNKKMHIKQK